MSKKIIALMGSHRSYGNTKAALDYYLEKLNLPDVAVIDINNMDLTPCTACDVCKVQQGRCVQMDDMETLRPALATADCIIIASPVYYSSFPSKMKAFIDRGQVFYRMDDKSKITPKKMVVLAVGGSPGYDDQFAGLYVTLHWYQANLHADLVDTVEIPNTDAIDVLDNPDALQELATSAKRLAHALHTMT